ncbi:MAG: hypothetical protein JO157_10800 [Acetobacteraceae bacterium]|nr:hypothetical protein [Acetobacteraceae bacterium]
MTEDVEIALNIYDGPPGVQGEEITIRYIVDPETKRPIHCDSYAEAQALQSGLDPADRAHSYIWDERYEDVPFRYGVLLIEREAQP